MSRKPQKEEKEFSARYVIQVIAMVLGALLLMGIVVALLVLKAIGIASTT